MKSFIKNSIYAGLACIMPLVADAGDRRICWVQSSEFGDSFSDYSVDFIKGEYAQINGQTCSSTSPDGECGPGTGVMTADNGKIEISFTGSHSYEYPGYGLVTTFVTSHIDYDLNSLTGVSSTIAEHISSIAPGVRVETYSGAAKIIDCPKPTKEDKDNMKTLRRFINKADNYK